MAKQTAEVTGNLTLTVDEEGKSAVATFTPGQGVIWTADAVLDLLKQKGVVEGYDAEEVRRQFSLLRSRSGPYTFTIAKGLEPVHARPETVRWETLAVPEDLQAQAAKVLGAAKPPVINIEKRMRVKRTRTFQKKTKLPFLKPREEQREVSEEQVTSERVYVDPTVERTGYALSGERLGTIEEQVEGVDGRAVTGKPIHARTVIDPHFYPGPGVTRRNEELFAEYEGFVRIGANWVDVVPFETHSWEVSFSDDMVTCYLSFNPGDPHAAAPTAEEVREEAGRHGYETERLLPDEEIASLIQRAVEQNQHLESVPVTASRDAGFDIFVSEDRMRAVLNVYKGTGRGKPLHLRELGRAIKESKLVGLDFDQIKKDIAEFVKSQQTELTGYTLAEGTQPEPGPERTAECSVRFLAAEETATIKHHLAEAMPGVVSEESLAEFPVEMIENLAYVEAEQRILAVSPPVAGKPGKDVFGQAVSGSAAEEPPVRAFENVEQKGNVYIATKAGLLHYGWSDGVVSIRVVEHQEADVTVRVSPAQMSALISLRPAAGTAAQLTWDQVEAAVSEAGVSRGVNVELLHRAHERAQSGTPVTDLIFARGQHPSGSSSGDIEMLIGMASGKSVTLRSDGSADFRNQDRITTVTAGTPLARIHLPSGAQSDGWDVTGSEVKAAQTQTVQVEAGANVSVVEETGGTRRMVADIDGELIFEDNRFEVRASHLVDGDVDLSTGNIRFPGNVTVNGSVRSGAYIVAGGDIMVGEIVEAALLSADGDIVINQGVKGSGKAVLRAKKNVGLVFGEHVTILAVGNVQVKNSLVHCNVKTNGKLRMIGDKCAIMGGEIRCRSGLETKQLGSPRGTRTSVSFGQDFVIADRIEREEKEMEKIKQEVAGLDFAMKEKQREHNKAELDALHAKKLMMLKMLEKRGLRIFTLRERFEEHQQSEVVVSGTVYPGVVLESHGRSLEISTEKKDVVFSFNPKSGRIEEQPRTRSDTA